MGFNPFEVFNRVELDFAEYERFKGAKVTCRADFSGEEQFKIFRDEAGELVTTKEEEYRAFGAKVLISWNCEDKDGPIAANADGMMKIPPAMCDAILAEWGRAVWNPSLPLSSPSTNGRERAAPLARMASR